MAAPARASMARKERMMMDFVERSKVRAGAGFISSSSSTLS